MMEKNKHKASQLDYLTLCDLARSRGIRYVEADGLDMRKGMRFWKDGTDWIAVDSSLPVQEKVRALGYLLENEPASVASQVRMTSMLSSSDTMAPVLSLCCS